MNIVFALGHPAHYHLFKNASALLKSNGNNVLFVITPKDVLETLLIANNEEFVVLAERKKEEGLFSKMLKIVNSTRALSKIVKQNNTDLIVGCLTQIAFVGKVMKIPSVFVGEDDFSYTWLQGMITYPVVSCILAPSPTNTGPFNHKRIAYQGYQKLAYLHPRWFSNTRIVKSNQKKNILIRLVNLSAYHDISAKGLNNSLIKEFIEKYKDTCKISISSERELPDSFEKYRLTIEPNKIHDEFLKTDLFIGDSQSMAVEASLLGVPNIRINNFADKISVLNEIEKKYQLTVSLLPENARELLELSGNLLFDENVIKIFSERREAMLSDKIDVTAFMVWFIENYPNSFKVMKENPNYQYNFK